ncbi:vacuolar sorting protein [Aureococcus anophagefferens]|uniref:Vacuolar sorting protein n=1 Tax=Aureococcus anophagefferens TaxID=44056 RepID=A0ABR1GCV2_AURAN
MAETVLSVDAVVATPVATKRWSLESDEVCLQELVRRSNVASAWRAGKIRRGVRPARARRCKIQCFHNSLVGFADWALLDVDGRGEWRATSAGRRERGRLDAAAADAARAAARAPPGALDSADLRDAANRAAAGAARALDETKAKHEVHLADAPGTLRSVVADNVEFEVLTEQSPACARAGATTRPQDALLAARAVLEAVFKFHPPLGDRADSTVACLESIDAALFGDDDDSDDDGERPGASPERGRGLRRRRAAGEPGGALRPRPRRAPGRVARRGRARRRGVADAAARRDADEGGRRRADAPSVRHLRSLPAKRSARAKLRALVGALEALAEELEKRQIDSVASDDLMPALCEAVRDARIETPHAQVAFAKHFCRDERVFLGVDGYALTSFEIALAALGDPSRAPPS